MKPMSVIRLRHSVVICDLMQDGLMGLKCLQKLQKLSLRKQCLSTRRHHSSGISCFNTANTINRTYFSHEHRIVTSVPVLQSCHSHVNTFAQTLTHTPSLNKKSVKLGCRDIHIDSALPSSLVPFEAVDKSLVNVNSNNLQQPHCSLHHLQRITDKSRHSVVDEKHRALSVSAKTLVDATPNWLQPYLKLIRMDKPIGTWLLYWPCTWSIALAGQPGHLPDVRMLALFGVGAFLMRGAGCIVNDMWDNDYDKKVLRTQLRPLACGDVTYFQAWCWLGFNLSLSLTVLLQLNWYSVYLGAASMVLVVGYPLMKRYTYWPQVFLGLTLNWGVLLSWSALHGSLEWPVIPMYIACVLYTMIYDTIYSHQDKYDDMLIGVKSTALKFGDQTKPWLTGFASIMTSGLLLSGSLCDQTWPYYVGVTATAMHLAYQIYDVDLSNPDSCLSKFKSNAWIGVFMFLGVVCGNLLRTSDSSNTEEETDSDSVSATPSES